MTILKKIFIKCDDCGKEEIATFQDSTNYVARRALRKRGWVHSGESDFCQQCAAKIPRNERSQTPISDMARTKGISPKQLCELAMSKNANHLSNAARYLCVKPSAVRYWLDSED